MVLHCIAFERYNRDTHRKCDCPGLVADNAPRAAESSWSALDDALVCNNYLLASLPSICRRDMKGCGAEVIVVVGNSE